MTRGIKHDVDRLITELQGKYLPYEYEKGKKGFIQFSVRPIQLWEFAFPEDHLQTVMKTLWNDDKHGIYGFSDKNLFLLRRLLGADKLPKLDPIALPMPIYKDNVQIVGVGVRKDRYFPEGKMKDCEMI